MTELIRRSDALDVIRNNGINSTGLVPRRDGDSLGLCFLDGLNALPAVARTFTKADVETVAIHIHQSWEDVAGYKNWVIAGNSNMQDKARRRAIAALSALGEVE
jgi:hypothetical protein